MSDTFFTQITEVFGWSAILSIAMLLFATLAIILFRTHVTKIHSKLFNLPEAELPIVYFYYLAYFKLLSLIFLVIPYLALKISGY